MSYDRAFVVSHTSEKKFLPVREAAKLVSYTPDYVSRLAREGKIDAEKRGRGWVVELDSLKLFSLTAKAAAVQKQQELSLERKRERVLASIPVTEDGAREPRLRARAVLESFAVTACLALIFILGHTAATKLTVADVALGTAMIRTDLQQASIASLMSDLSWPTWLWLFKTEETWAVEEVAPRVSPSEAASVDVVAGDVFRIRATSAPDRQLHQITHAFSDEVSIEFVDGTYGTITPHFVDGAHAAYPVTLIPELVDNPSEN